MAALVKQETLREQLETIKRERQKDADSVARALEALDKYPGVEDLIRHIVGGWGR